LDAVAKFVTASRQKIELRREPSNPVDPYAVAVFGQWSDGEGEEGEEAHLGYLPREVAKEVSELLERGGLEPTIAVLYAPYEDRGPGIRLDLWTHRRPPKRILERPYDSTISVPADSVERNLQGRALETQGLVYNAIEFYEANVADRFDGSFPYDRLAVLFRRSKEIDREVAVLETAIEVFDSLRPTSRPDIEPKIAKFRARLMAKALAGSKWQQTESD
jgi:hypothetical protein